MQEYNPKELEEKWQRYWEEHQTYQTTYPSSKKKKYVLDMFPYPSGSTLHVGHPKGYIATDVYARMMRMQGYEVLHPMGWDAFGLPAEQYALKHKVHPRTAVLENITRFKEQLKMIGFDYDWSRELQTIDPSFYKWTQWAFIQMYKRGLAYQSWEPINWCPSCQTGLAQEDLEDGRCERCGSAVEKKPMRQWVLRITDYADRLLDDLEMLSKWPRSVIESQKNWIGKSEGATLTFETTIKQLSIPVFTTRAETLFGVTFIALAPEAAILQDILPHLSNRDAVTKYVRDTEQQSDLDRQQGGAGDGIQLDGVEAIHPITKKTVPVFVASYVLANYGEGAVMGVPGHDERDAVFAQAHNLDQPTVISTSGVLEHSGPYTGRRIEEARAEIANSIGTPAVSYRLNDWVFSRQRYWGEPIPIIHCDTCGAVPVPEEALPVTLPVVEAYEPTGTGESPLALIDEWVHTTCPSCGGAGKRETNTMPQWAGSSWYYLRFMDPDNSTALVSKDAEAYFAPVDVYVGGMEHATRHLIYARFWHKFLYDCGVVSTVEPFTELHTPGLVLAADGRKMSKRWNNTVTPDDMVLRFGADAFRLYQMFMGPFEHSIAWNTDGVVGTRRFLERVWRMHERVAPTGSVEGIRLVHQSVKKVTEDILTFNFNTAVSQMMVCLNTLEKEGVVDQKSWSVFLQILAPFAPHITEELWELLGEEGSIHTAPWPSYDPDILVSDMATIAVQINGKVRTTLLVQRDATEVAIRDTVIALPEIRERLDGKTVERVIYIPGKVINIVTG